MLYGTYLNSQMIIKKYQDRAAIADRLILTVENKTDITTS